MGAGTLSIMRRVVAEEGVAGLFRGCTARVAAIAVEFPASAVIKTAFGSNTTGYLRLLDEPSCGDLLYAARNLRAWTGLRCLVTRASSSKERNAKSASCSAAILCFLLNGEAGYYRTTDDTP